jgi:4-carboxymuconolactone decarboxylase
LVPQDLDAAQRELYDSITGGRRAQGPRLFPLRDDRGALEGPFNAFLLQPRLGNALQMLGAAVRYDTTLGNREREIAILVVAVAWDSGFEWHAHEAVGRHAGLSDADLDAVRSGTFAELPTVAEQVVAVTTHALATRDDLADDEYARAVGVLGLPRVFELLTLVGYYAALALQLRVFRVAPPQTGPELT